MKNGFYKYTDDDITGDGYVMIEVSETNKSYIFKLIENTSRHDIWRILSLFNKNGKAIIAKKGSGHPIRECGIGFAIYPYQDGIPYFFNYIGDKI